MSSCRATNAKADVSGSAVRITSDKLGTSSGVNVSQHLPELAEKVRALSPADRLRLAASLLEEAKATGKVAALELARTVLDGVSLEIGATLGGLAMQRLTAKMKGGHGG
jgi:uncharacterized protein (DUF2237 family)